MTNLHFANLSSELSSQHMVIGDTTSQTTLFVGLDWLRDWHEANGREPNLDEATAIQRATQRYEQEAARMKSNDLWHPVTHDRRVELVFIGDETMQRDAIEDAVEAAMLTNEELPVFLDSWSVDGVSHTTVVNPFSVVPRCVQI